jgi:ArsR family transcriptional regulator, arsenate/arsenite/antimonite-responsive transcriptional repressor
MREILNITKALADGSRLRILMMLRRQELCVCQIVEVLQLANSTVSKHLSILHSARLIENRKEGRWVWYRLPDPKQVNLEVAQAIGYVVAHLSEDEQIARDRSTLASTLLISPEELCRKQHTR